MKIKIQSLIISLALIAPQIYSQDTCEKECCTTQEQSKTNITPATSSQLDQIKQLIEQLREELATVFKNLNANKESCEEINKFFKSAENDLNPQTVDRVLENLKALTHYVYDQIFWILGMRERGVTYKTAKEDFASLYKLYSEKFLTLPVMKNVGLKIDELAKREDKTIDINIESLKLSIELFKNMKTIYATVREMNHDLEDQDRISDLEKDINELETYLKDYDQSKYAIANEKQFETIKKYIQTLKQAVEKFKKFLSTERIEKLQSYLSWIEEHITTKNCGIICNDLIDQLKEELCDYYNHILPVYPEISDNKYDLITEMVKNNPELIKIQQNIFDHFGTILIDDLEDSKEINFQAILGEADVFNKNMNKKLIIVEAMVKEIENLDTFAKTFNEVFEKIKNENK
ncbi:TPA: hypothetical protein DEO28_02895 [Candidatus Dependentiae bacterium]|nr:MAG: hypothetical protein UR14_C0005G0070 [candidate division TM6 bacterium GW2011_GWE2_31_21]KKP53146.1 MAG: hypothetical protein UR43_C0007G0070 [candidate division TM6 bacterium GW2011_GWF2_33_332]HBS47965.1 hypothetical protein [Candidatus Dependentiae bacterium]HBZ73431.1 hypothetical protein [Candidatus Dependentiae bacterium]